MIVSRVTAGHLGFLISLPIVLQACASASGPKDISMAEREERFKMVRYIVSETMAEPSQSLPTNAEYVATCHIIEDSEWGLATSFTHPDTSQRLSGIAGSMSGLFAVMEDFDKEEGARHYGFPGFRRNLKG